MVLRWGMSDQPAIPIGARVVLRTCPNAGQPGTVLRIERGKLAVLWADIAPDYVRLHRAESLRLA
jgi:hypothetical protein